MKALSAITTGCEEPGGVTEMTGDLPSAWAFLSSGGASLVSLFLWNISSS
jgi:hypothetical protein